VYSALLLEYFSSISSAQFEIIVDVSDPDPATLDFFDLSFSFFKTNLLHVNVIKTINPKTIFTAPFFSRRKILTLLDGSWSPMIEV
jgi:hypothetical protein